MTVRRTLVTRILAEESRRYRTWVVVAGRAQFPEDYSDLQ
jgi:hypothetical protein